MLVEWAELSFTCFVFDRKIVVILFAILVYKWRSISVFLWKYWSDQSWEKSNIFVCNSRTIRWSFSRMNSSNSFLVNHWFGPNLEQFVTVPVINYNESWTRFSHCTCFDWWRFLASNIYAISIKTADVSDSSREKILSIQVHFDSWCSLEIDV